MSILFKSPHRQNFEVQCFDCFGFSRVVVHETRPDPTQPEIDSWKPNPSLPDKIWTRDARTRRVRVGYRVCPKSRATRSSLHQWVGLKLWFYFGQSEAYIPRDKITIWKPLVEMSGQPDFSGKPGTRPEPDGLGCLGFRFCRVSSGRVSKHKYRVGSGRVGFHKRQPDWTRNNQNIELESFFRWGGFN